MRQELQADCFAGIWAREANRDGTFLETGDIEEGLTAASAIGDDTLQRNAGQAVVPDAFTHGTSEQRIRWFKTGYESDATRLIRDLLREKPQLADEQAKGRAQWWDRKLDLEQLRRARESRVPQKPYVYQTSD